MSVAPAFAVFAVFAVCPYVLHNLRRGHPAGNISALLGTRASEADAVTALSIGSAVYAGGAITAGLVAGEAKAFIAAKYKLNVEAQALLTRRAGRSADPVYASATRNAHRVARTKRLRTVIDPALPIEAVVAGAAVGIGRTSLDARGIETDQVLLAVDVQLALTRGRIFVTAYALDTGLPGKTGLPGPATAVVTRAVDAKPAPARSVLSALHIELTRIRFGPALLLAADKSGGAHFRICTAAGALPAGLVAGRTESVQTQSAFGALVAPLAAAWGGDRVGLGRLQAEIATADRTVRAVPVFSADRNAADVGASL
ncbi:MAG: hypothetical protein AAF662_15325 [Pseudomonadota bacterium]